ncbi:peptidase, T1 family [Ancylostoma ceylanicum]|uniref:Proteasome subunit alpha type n=2 Tax=Ancylostoma ceylanicum TaxID=53326 RepID=A0A0D6LUZ0_9BILA|nr:peptidase, T1 family [Ancylostoma ceylanicum]EYC11825.1 hypothetical protein Y032_0049g1797 [Ancylostoma ceylanicum]
MSSIGTGYDLAASTFSPDGRIFQIEYAQKAVDNSGTMIALRGKNGVVTAVDKVITSKMYEENANPRMFNANENIGLALAGVYPDCRALKDYACNEAVKYLKDYRQPMPVQKLANALAEYVHIFTLGISRPFGASAFFTSWDEKDGGKLFLVEPSGLCYEYKAWAVGKHRQAAKAEIEKLKLEDFDMKDLVKEAARIIMAIRDENKDKDVQIELGWVGKHTEGRHETVPNDVVAAAEEWARAKLDEDDMDE